MPDLQLLLRKLNFESHGQHQAGGHDKLLQLIIWMQDSLVALEEQERWVRDDYPLDAGQASNLADNIVQEFISQLLLDTENFGQDYLTRQTCTCSTYDNVMDSLAHYKKHCEEQEAKYAINLQADLDDHLF
jgi:hypothetical protein